MRTNGRTNGRTKGRRLVAAGLSLGLASGALLATGLSASAQDDAGESVRVDENGFRVEEPLLGGFQTDGSMTPVTIRMFEPVLPVPTEAGVPQGELALQYTRALVGTGPASRGLASSFWIGATVGDGFDTICNGCGQDYPFKADAKYPDGPFESTDRYDPNSGAGMYGEAHGLDALGRAQSSGTVIPEMLSVGFMDSQSTSSVVDGIASVESMARIQGLSFMDGLVTVDDFQSVLTAASNGEVGTSEATVTVVGLSVMGQSFSVTSDGIVQGDDTGDELIVDFGGGKSIDLLSSAGVEVSFAGFSDDDEGPAASRTSGGLVISLDLTPIKSFVDDLGLPIAEAIGAIPIDGVVPIDAPDNPVFCANIDLGNCVKASLFTFATLSPRVDLVLGFGDASAVATTPFNFDFSAPASPVLPSAPQTGASTGGFIPSTSAPTFSTGSATPQVAAPSPSVAAPAPAPAAGLPSVALSSDIPLSTPVGAAALLAGLFGVMLLARGLIVLSSSVVGPLGAASTSASQVPDLRSF